MLTSLAILGAVIFGSAAILSFIAAKLDSRGYDGDVVDYDLEHRSLLERML